MAGKRTLTIDITGNPTSAQRAMGAVNGAARGMGQVLIGVGVAGAAALGGLGAAAISVGNQFNQSRNSIAQATGATGEALDGLYNDFKAALGQVPDDMGTVAAAIGTANTLFGATGDELSGLTTQLLDFSRLAGGDAARNTEAMGQIASIFGASADESAAALDAFFKVTQDTNIGGEKLLNLMQTFGPVFQNAGFSMTQTASVIGDLHAAGVDLTRVGPALNAFFRRTAEAGKDPQEALAATEAAIRNASSASEALNIATEAFGSEGAQRMVSAIRDGNVALTDLADNMDETDGLLSATADATASMSEKWAEFKNRVLVAVEPLVTRLFDSLMRGMDWLTATGIPAIQRIVDVFGESGLSGVAALVGTRFREMWPQIREALGTFLDGYIDFVVDLWSTIGSMMVDGAKALWEWVEPQIGPTLEQLGEWIGEVANWIIDTGLPTAVEKLAEFGAAFVEWVVPLIPPMLSKLGTLLVNIGTWITTDAAPKLVGYLAEWTGQFVGWAVTDLGPKLLSAMGQVLSSLGAWIKDDAAPTVKVKLLAWTSQFTEWAGGIPGAIKRAMSGLGERLWEAIQDAWNYLKNKVSSLNPIKMPSLDIPGFGSVPSIGKILAEVRHGGGTIVPPTGQREQLILARRGERVLTPGQAVAATPNAGMGSVRVFVGPHELVNALVEYDRNVEPILPRLQGGVAA